MKRAFARLACLAGLAASAQEISWRDRYELGPGDSVNVSFYGNPALNRPGLKIAPDGTLTYLQLNAVRVAGKTIDEIRETLEVELSRYHQAPRLIVTPGEIASKHYVILGKVVDRGVFPLDRPLTLLEAIARSRGLETGLVESRTVELADLGRSFVARNGRKLPVDFEKLYLEGDLSQNLGIEPGDYIYIASALRNEFQVLGAVREPGVQALTPRMGVVEAIARRQGFAEGAWKERVLVLRGSLEQPQTIVVDVAAVLEGKAPDTRIEPGDLLYVHTHPWHTAGQILDSAVRVFIQSATATWVNEYVQPLPVGPVLPGRSSRENW